MIIEIINQMNNNTNISIIIPVFNEINFIGKILQLVNLQKKFFNIQIIVSDDGSNDGTYEFLNINKKLYIKNVKLKLSMTDLKFVYTNSNKNIKIK
jgi:glycosyltransferase involved in cell wall biosynthesis